MIDMINHPPHYTAHPSGVECIEITEHYSFCLGNAIKYIWRAGLKTDDPVEDLRKAQFYLAREIARLEPEVDTAKRIDVIRAARSILSSVPRPVPTDAPPNSNPAADGTSLAEAAVQPPDAAVDPSCGAPGGAVSETTAPQVSSLPGAVQSPDVQADTTGGPSGGAYVTGPYSEAEIEQAAALLRAGKGAPEIAAALNRDPRGVHVAIRRARKAYPKGKPAPQPGVQPHTPGPRQAVAERPAAPVAVPHPPPVSGSRPPEPGGAAVPSGSFSAPSAQVGGAKTGIRREVAQWLTMVNNDATWTPAKDLALAECIVRGDGIAGAAMEIEIPSEDCRARWQLLTEQIRTGKGLSIDGQSALMAELRERALDAEMMWIKR
ncbi:DUF3310 domain-containing protein [Roseicyclus amphidinii]|uniref:DUF3310 domain-containing protein n=1 Tax=Roseicyclus amphidinii TaxID=3034232 RepID=UPI0024E0464B|nr:DUF3310 domain-containing protein [Roseicyclus sp. Amp-Y-6]